MPEMTKHEPGMLSWADLSTTDAEGARAFYTALFGWTPIDMPIDDTSVYTMLTKDGKNAAALFQITPEMAEQGMVPGWNAYVTVPDADAAAAKAVELGGVLVDGPVDVFEAGRMAIIQDPTGAVFFIWQPKQEIGAQVMIEPGSLAWFELYTHDTEAAASFYEGLFGWGRRTHQMPTGEYHEFHIDGQSAAGMMAIEAEWGEVPPNWTVYFAVERIGPALEQVESLGGTVRVQPQSVPEVGTFALVSDPQDGYFMLIEFEEAAQPE